MLKVFERIVNDTLLEYDISLDKEAYDDLVMHGVFILKATEETEPGPIPESPEEVDEMLFGFIHDPEMDDNLPALAVSIKENLTGYHEDPIKNLVVMKYIYIGIYRRLAMYVPALYEMTLKES